MATTINTATVKAPRLKKDGTPWKINTDRNNLTMAQKVSLANLVKDEYTSSEKNDVEFAEYAADKLKFEVNSAQIARTRKAFELEANKTEREKVSTLRARIAELEKFITVNNLEIPAVVEESQDE
jgi:ABC-type Fe3+/spermidine/putrescine transport system ATPase subunit